MKCSASIQKTIITIVIISVVKKKSFSYKFESNSREKKTFSVYRDIFPVHYEKIPQNYSTHPEVLLPLYRALVLGCISLKRSKSQLKVQRSLQ